MRTVAAALLLLGGVLAGCQVTTTPVLIPNTAPSIVLLLPTLDPELDAVPTDVDGGLQFRAGLDDAEDDSEELRIIWEAVQTGVGNDDRIELGESQGDSSGTSDFTVAGLEIGTWLIVATVYDTDGATDDASMPIEVIGANTAPEVTILAPEDDQVFVEGETVTFSASTGDDRGPEQLSAEWFDDLNGVLSTAPPSGAGLLTFSTADLAVGDHLVTLTVTDISNLQAQDSVAFRVVSADLPPTTPSVDVTPDEPSTADDLICLVTVASTDPEGLAVTMTYSWLVDGSPTAWIDPVLDADQTSTGETWTCEVRGNDGVLDSEAGSDSVTVSGSPPTLESVDLGPTPAYETTTLTCAGVGFEDPDEDLEGYDDVVWYVNGVAVAGAVDFTLDGTDFDRDDIVECELTPFDGGLYGDTILSDGVIIDNTAPTTPSVSITPNPSAGLDDDLVCAGSGSTDIDPADSVSYTPTWTQNGTPAPSYDGVWTVPSSATALGDVWICTVVATDGTDLSASAFDSIDVLPQSGDLVVSEYLPDPDFVSDSSGEWIEVYNASGTTISLLDWELHDDGIDSHFITTDVSIAPGARVVLGRNEDPASNGGVTVHYEYGSFTLEAVDEIVLSFDGVEVDRIEYDWSSLPAGHSASLNPGLGAPDAGENDFAINWCGSTTPLTTPGSDFGTPGQINDSCACWDSDNDDDGYGDDGSCPFIDCNDSNPSINAEATDICENGLDEDCIGGDLLCDCLTTDGDGDGYGTGSACVQIDCDDGNSTINPGATEVCDADDNDCDGSIDEGFDLDGDTWTTCEGDCDDTDGTINPNAIESCDFVDEDCDGAVDEGFDADIDGWTTCEGDCDDGSNLINPSQSDGCNGVDNDCDGVVDDEAAGDSYEVNDSSAQAVVIATNNSTSTSYATFQYSTDNYDWYAIATTDDTDIICDEFNVSASMSSIPAGTDYDLYLYDESLNLIDYSIAVGNAGESVGFSAGCLDWGDDGGTYYLRVTRWSGYSCSDTYRLDTSNSN